MSKNITTAGTMTLEETASEYELKHFSSDITSRQKALGVELWGEPTLHYRYHFTRNPNQYILQFVAVHRMKTRKEIYKNSKRGTKIFFYQHSQFQIPFHIFLPEILELWP